MQSFYILYFRTRLLLTENGRVEGIYHTEHDMRYASRLAAWKLVAFVLWQ